MRLCVFVGGERKNVPGGHVPPYWVVCGNYVVSKGERNLMLSNVLWNGSRVIQLAQRFT